MIRHAGLIARHEAGAWRGALIEGPSGSGKSDLMLRALGVGWRLVADDRVIVWTSGGRLFGRAPPMLAGLIEIRGLGVLPAPPLAFAEIRLLARCVEAERVERMPEPELEALLGLTLPAIRLTALQASAPSKLACALTRLGVPAQASYLPCGAGGDLRMREGSREFY